MKENLKKIFQGISSGKYTQAEALEKIKLLKAQEQGKTAGMLLAAPVWEPAVAGEDSPAVFAQRYIFLFEMPEVNETQLSALLRGSQIIPLPALPQQDIATRYERYALLCFEHIRRILSSKPQEKILVQVVTGNSDEQQVFTGLSGLLKTATLENPLLAGQIIVTHAQATADTLARQLNECSRQIGDQEISYQQDVRYVLRRKDIPAAEANPKVVFKDQGVYLITGGTGGIGMLFTSEILRQTARSIIILTGRSALTPAKKAMLDALPVRNNKVEYRQLDLGDREAVCQLIADINAHKPLNGILHCAGMTADNFIIKKSGEEFSGVLSPKVTGTFNLDEASKDTDLDFLVLFSSVASVMGNVGQCDYAAANGFMDRFAVYRHQLTLAGQRYGQTLSVNWPLWQEGGMQIDAANKEILRQTMDMLPMSTIAGMYAFYGSMAWQQQQVMVIPDQAMRMDHQPRQQTSEINVVTAIDTDNIFEKTEAYLCTELSSLLKLTAHKIDPQAALEKYGIDSILAMSLTSRLEKTFGSLPKTLFFEYTSIHELTGYFVKSHQAQLAVLFHQPVTPVKEQPTLKADQQLLQQPMPGKRFSRPGGQAASKQISHPFHNEPIAIIGLSGRYPQSADIDAYWRNLRDGKDCITEVPSSRWA
ncbi:SDR family NAD(P)-dependent oxidoreductase, partial [Chitinophaga varians]|uniref:SDR family NAD(P)-dependent oxidoreductase n=1 Tax=Chitinophaga varians TaxID=2202339 RepID=UPI00165FBAF1